LVGFLVCDRLRIVIATQIIEEIKRLGARIRIPVGEAVGFPAAEIDAYEKIAGVRLSLVRERSQVRVRASDLASVSSRLRFVLIND